VLSSQVVNSYRYTAPEPVAWYEHTTRNNSVGFTKNSERPYIIAHKNDTGSTQSTTRIIISMAQNESPNGLMYGGIWNNDSPNPSLIATSTNSFDVNTLTSNPTFENKTFDFSATDVLANYSVGCFTDISYGTGDNFPVIGVDITSGDTEYRIDGANWTNYADRLLTCTILG